MRKLAKALFWGSLRARIALSLVGLTLALGIVALAQAYIDLHNILEQQLQDRGAAIAMDLASKSGAPSQTNDVFGLYQVVNDSLLNNQDVRYVFLEEPSGDVRVHTFPEGVPPALAEANRWAAPAGRSVRLLRTNEGPILDIAVPVLGGQAGTIRLGMSEARLQGQVASYIARLAVLVGTAVLCAVALSFVVSGVLTRPLRRVAEAARRVGGGDLSTRVPVDPAHELGHLARAFNSMTEDLLRSQQSLVQRNSELQILNAMAETLSTQLGRKQVLATSLDRLLELTALSGAWVCTRAGIARMNIAAFSGAVPGAQETKDAKGSASCRCNALFNTGRAASSLSDADCPLAADAPCAMVPLWSRNDVVAVLGVASRRPEDLTAVRLHLLAGIGRQMGIALENAALYEELEKKERMRADLLEKIIGAQEDERKRVAREIHDEPAQALSAVIFQIDALRRQLAASRGVHPHDVDIEDLRLRVRTAMESLHRITTELRPQALDDLGLVPAIRWFARQRLADRGTQVELQVDGLLQRPPPTVEVAVFRITQEAISNIAKHADAANVRIALAFDASAIRGTIEDDGRGFDAEGESGSPVAGAGLGILGMRERAALLGGSLSLVSSPGRGTIVRFEIPLPQGVLIHGPENQGADSR